MRVIHGVYSILITSRSIIQISLIHSFSINVCRCNNFDTRKINFAFRLQDSCSQNFFDRLICLSFNFLKPHDETDCMIESRVEIPLKNRSRFMSGLGGLGGLGGFFGKTAQTAQILLKKPLKNRSFLAVIFERFFKQDLSGF